jgi:hypothetical protein
MDTGALRPEAWPRPDRTSAVARHDIASTSGQTKADGQR